MKVLSQFSIVVSKNSLGSFEVIVEKDDPNTLMQCRYYDSNVRKEVNTKMQLCLDVRHQQTNMFSKKYIMAHALYRSIFTTFNVHL